MGWSMVDDGRWMLPNRVTGYRPLAIVQVNDDHRLHAFCTDERDSTNTPSVTGPVDDAAGMSRLIRSRIAEIVSRSFSTSIDSNTHGCLLSASPFIRYAVAGTDGSTK